MIEMIVKFTHLVVVILLLGSLFSSATLSNLNPNQYPSAWPYSKKNDRLFLLIWILQLLLGSTLVLLNHYAFKTPWIVHAYILFALGACCSGAIIHLKRTRTRTKTSFPLNAMYFTLLMICFNLIYDAVSKHPLF